MVANVAWNVPWSKSIQPLTEPRRNKILSSGFLFYFNLAKPALCVTIEVEGDKQTMIDRIEKIAAKLDQLEDRYATTAACIGTIAVIAFFSVCWVITP